MERVKILIVVAEMKCSCLCIVVAAINVSSSPQLTKPYLPLLSPPMILLILFVASTDSCHILPLASATVEALVPLT